MKDFIILKPHSFYIKSGKLMIFCYVREIRAEKRIKIKSVKK